MNETTAGLPEGCGGELVIAAADYRRDRAAWLRARRSGLGASETAAILGLNPWTTGLKIWQEKTNTEEPDDSDTSEAAEMGHLLEHPVASRTVKRHPELGKLVPSPGLLRHPEYPWMLATVDRLLTPRGGDGRVGSLLEVKTTSEPNYRRNWVEGVPPASVLVQVQQQLAVTGLPFGWVTVLVGGQKIPEPFRVERSEEVIEQLIRYGGMWWEEHMVKGTRPEPVFLDRDALAALWPADLGLDAITAGPDLEKAIADLIDAKRRKTEAEQAEDGAAFILKTAMRERTGIKDRAGEVLVTWKEQTTRRLDSRALEKAHPKIAAEFKPAKVSRVLRVVNKKEQ